VQTIGPAADPRTTPAACAKRWANQGINVDTARGKVDASDQAVLDGRAEEDDNGVLPIKEERRR